MGRKGTNGHNGHLPPAKQAVSPLNGIAPPVEHQFKPGQSGNPSGRPSAGLSILEWVNQMAGWSEAQVQSAADDADAPMAKRIAAARVLSAAQRGDDFDRICDRTIGKPKQGVELSGGVDYRERERSTADRMMGDDAAREQAMALAERMAEMGSEPGEVVPGDN